MQMALFEELPTFHGFKGEDGAHWRAGSGVARNWRGYFRWSESGQGLGSFYVSGFSGPEHGNGMAHVLMIDKNGDEYTVPHTITESGVLIIMGQRYDRRYWDH